MRLVANTQERLELYHFSTMTLVLLLLLPIPIYIGFEIARTAHLMSEQGLDFWRAFFVVTDPRVETLILVLSGLPLLLIPAVLARRLRIVADPGTGTLEVSSAGLWRRRRMVFALEDVAGADCDERTPRAIQTNRTVSLRIKEGDRVRTVEITVRMTLDEVNRTTRVLKDWLRRYHAVYG